MSLAQTSFNQMGFPEAIWVFLSIGYLVENSANQKSQASNSALYETVTVKKDYLFGAYQANDPVKSATVTVEKTKEEIATATATGQFSALGKMALFPGFMLACYLALMFHFNSKGG